MILLQGAMGFSALVYNIAEMLIAVALPLATIIMSFRSVRKKSQTDTNPLHLKSIVVIAAQSFLRSLLVIVVIPFLLFLMLVLIIGVVDE